MLTPMTNNPLFGLVITVFTFYLSKRLFAWKSIIIFNPLILAPGTIILLLTFTKIEYEQYKSGAQILSYFLGPATVALAIPFYKKLKLIKQNLKAIIIGTVVASATSIISVIIMSRLLKVSDNALLSMVAKSATGPIAIGVTESLGGLEPLIILSVVITGTFGGIIGAEVLRILGVKDSVSMGLTLGASSHAGGTTRAILLGQTEGAFSGVAMVTTGLGVAVLAPILIKILL